ncbi:carbohydrate binding domain-containing protein [Actinomadura sp. 9N215]|uniref:carbohydrate binding domain-containing protein n=1 Tax=Actinomadura sp. 9N215 TaxID=3375150 RepID=UPI0037B6C1DD
MTAQFPELSIQAAFRVGASTSTLLTLDDPTRGRLDTGTLGDGSEQDPVWVELADRATEGKGIVSRGSQRIDSPIVQYEPGTLSVPLANHDRDLDPSNLNGPYTQAAGAQDGTTYVLNDNPGFEDGLTSWTGIGGALSQDTTVTHAGTASGKIVPDGVSALVRIDSDPVPVEASQTYRAQGWVRCAAARNVSLNINWFDASGGYLDTSVNAQAVAADTWTIMSADMMAPAGAAQANIIPTLDGTPPPSAVLWVDEVELSQQRATQVTAMRAVRVLATWANVVYELFQGTADAWDVHYEDPGQAITTLAATDGFKVLAGISRAAAPAAGEGETTGARITRILDSAGWSTQARDIDDGDTIVQATTLDGEVLAELQITADSEIGELYIDGGGRVRFRARNALLTDARSNTAQAVFGDDGDELPYKDLGVSSDDATFYNEVRVTRAARADEDPPDEPVEQVADDTTSQALFYKRTFTPPSAPILDADQDALAYAQWLAAVASYPELRFTELTLEPAVAANELWPHALGRQIGDRITIIRRPPGGGDPIEMDCFIRGITHEFGDEEWITKWALQSATRYGGFLVLDDALLGRLDENRLAY